ncbi:MAG: hypothetical protein EF806_04840 [Candidatus Methanoliparum thermophilum]|uniref:Uncharacterized protein n=1 Tax=Methanoliparum thermophilum TaxID=2491083 RepID=A0A520KRJ1_METT2|nr:hypothetical protein [Candidatus Methanoliparum sp. LAM-1]RZN64305.1 MAG: hypothetical protein EF806_04840 [Candidatus Methanoliparum thermophilum]BDC35565.1 hypothetical protein MTLP_02470 [Candidatus Methanoliparum sp. LAM-1]
MDGSILCCSLLAAAVCHNIADFNGKDNLILSTLRIPEWSVPFTKFMIFIYKSYAAPVLPYLNLSKEKLNDGTNAATSVRRGSLCIMDYSKGSGFPAEYRACRTC